MKKVYIITMLSAVSFLMIAPIALAEAGDAVVQL